MSSPIPHTSKCGMDETLDQTGTTQIIRNESATEPVLTGSATAMSNVQEHRLEQETMHEVSNVVSTPPAGASNVQMQANEHPTTPDTQASTPTEPAENQAQGAEAAPRPMAPFEIARYATQIGITYPTTNGPELYRIAALIPAPLRAAFEEGLGEAVSAYYDEVGKQGHEPTPQPVPDILALYLLPGLVSAAEVFAAYERARVAGHAQAFEEALRERNDRALEVLNRWLEGRRSSEAVFIPRPGGDAWA